MIKVVYLSPSSEDKLMQYPSNYSYYIQELNRFDDVQVHVVNTSDIRGNSIKRFFEIVRIIRKINPDILYIMLWMGYNSVVLAKILHLISGKIVIWKYTECIDSNNPVKHVFYKYLYWRNIDLIYMVSQTHAQKAIASSIVPPSKIKILSRGCDVNWYSKFVSSQENIKSFSVIATGQDNRDYETLAKACEETHTKCKIITRAYQEHILLAEKYRGSEYVDIEILPDGFTKSDYEYIMEEVGKHTCMAICCRVMPYGNGYTNIVETLPFVIPIIQTSNPNVPFDPELRNVGLSVKEYDVDGWKKAIMKLKTDATFYDDCCNNIRALIAPGAEYNSETTANIIRSDFMELTKKRLI